jgi:hypothetical protein
MTRRKKIFRIAIIVLGAFLVLLLAFQIIVPKLINLESIKGKILASASEKVGGEVKCGKIGLSFFPYPHVVINQVSLSIPEKVRGSMNALGVYAKFLPLLKGKLQIAEVTLESPVFKVVLPTKATKKPEKELPPPSLDIPALSSQILVPLILEAPSLAVGIENGKLDLSQADESLFFFKDINASVVLPPEGFKIRLSSTSNLWERMGLKSTLNATNYKGEVRIDLNHFQPHRLTNLLPEDSHLKLADSSVNMSVDINVNGLNNLQAEIRGSIPFLSFQNGNNKVAIKSRSLKSLFTLDENEITFSLAELNLEYPKVNLSGSFLLGRRTPRVQVEFQGRDVDVPTVREVALAFAGDVSDVQEIFGILRGGKVPIVTVKSEGSTYDHVGDLKNILIKGHIVEGKIMVPGVELDLADVKGDAVISEAVLHGENLEARVGNSWGREGKLKLALQGEDKPFHLDIGVQADLAELPPVMKRLLNDKSFQKELGLIKGLKGDAEGRLVLGESMEAVKPRVDVSTLNLSAKYQRIPYPLEIGGGHFHYDGTSIGVKSLRGKLGNTSFNQLSASLDLEKELYLNVKSADIDLSDEEIITWLKSMEGSGVRLENIKSVKGNSRVSALELKGPLLSPGKWQIKTAYEPRGTVVETTFLPGPIEITKGKFKGSVDPKRQELTFRDLQIRMLDASMNVSGALNDYYKGLNNMDLSLDGVVGSESNRWVASLLKTPPQLVLRTPFSISKGHLRWKKDAVTSFKADLTMPSGANISTDILYSPEEIKAKGFIKDDVSQASSAFRLKGNELDLQFKGRLKKETLNNLFVQNGFFYGWLEGDFQAYISLDHPMKSTARGHLMGEDLIFPRELEIPLEIEKISLKAKERHVDVEQATLVSGSHKVDLEGSLDFSPPGLVFNIDVTSNGISWTDMEALLGEGGEENALEQEKASWNLPIQGTVRLKSEYFNYERFTWFPFHADITFAQNEIDVKFVQAKLCHISTPGSLKITPQDVSLDFDFAARDQELNPSILCISGQGSDYTGRFDLLAKIKARGKEDKLLQSLNGNLEFTARDGRIRRSVPLQRVFAYLNVTKSLRGQLPDMTRDEFIYNSITAKGTFEDGKAILNEAILDSPSMQIISQGYLDYIRNEIDLLILVAPFKTVDWVVKKIPLVRRVLQGTLIAVPVKVTGDLADPKVSPMSASAVGSSLLGVLKRTLELPVTVIEPGGPGAEVIPDEPEE